MCACAPESNHNPHNSPWLLIWVERHKHDRNARLAMKVAMIKMHLAMLTAMWAVMRCCARYCGIIMGLMMGQT